MRLVWNCSCTSALPGSNAVYSINYRWQGFEIDRHQFGRILRLVAALRHDHCDRLADMPNLVDREQRLLGQLDRVSCLSSPLARQRYLCAWDGGRYTLQVSARKRRYDTGHCGSAREIDRSDARMRDGSF